MRTRRTRPKPRTQKNPRPRTYFLRTDPLEAKAKDQGHNFSKFWSFSNNNRSPENKTKKRSSGRSPQNFREISCVLQKRNKKTKQKKQGHRIEIRKFSARFHAFSEKKKKVKLILVWLFFLSANQKMVLSSSRGQEVFEDLKATS